MVQLLSRDDLTKLVSAIVETQIDPAENLVAQGLDSLGAVELLEALHQRGLDVDYAFLLDGASIDGLLGTLRETADVGPTPAAAGPSFAPFPLTGPQKIWAALEAEGWGNWANISLCLSMPASLIRATYLPAMAQSLCDANDAMRMVLTRQGHDGTEIYQKHIPNFQLPVELRDAPALDRDAMRQVAAFEDITCTPFAPSTRALVLSSAAPEGRHWLCITMHHVFSDRISMQGLARQFQDMVVRQDLKLMQPRSVQYCDVAAWKAPSEKDVAQDENALRDLMDGADVFADRPVPRAHGFAPDDFENFPTTAALSPTETEAFAQLAGRAQTTMPLLVHAVTSVLVACITGDEKARTGETDVLLCHVVSNRERHAALKDLVGCLDTTVPVAVLLAPDETLMSLCHKTRHSFAAAHQYVSDMPRGGWLASGDEAPGALFERFAHINFVRAPTPHATTDLDLREHTVRRVQKTRWGLLLRVDLPGTRDASGGDDAQAMAVHAFAEDRVLARLVPYCLVALLRLLLTEDVVEAETSILDLVDRVLDRARFAASQVRHAASALTGAPTGDAFIYDKLVARQQRWYQHDANHMLCRDESNRFIGTAANPFPFTQLDKLKERRFLEQRGVPLPKLLHVLPKDDLAHALAALAPDLPPRFAIKPVGAGHSFGVTLVRDGVDLTRGGVAFDATTVATALSDMAARGYCRHEGRVFPFNFSSFLVEDLVIDERGFPAPTDYKVFMIGETVLWVQLHFKQDGFNWVAFVDAAFELLPQPAWDPRICWQTHGALVCTDPAMVDARKPACLSAILDMSRHLAVDLGIFVRLDWYADANHGPLMGEMTTFPHMLQPRAFYTPWANQLVQSLWQDPDGVAPHVDGAGQAVAHVAALFDKGFAEAGLEGFLPSASPALWAMGDTITYAALRTYVADFDLAPWGAVPGDRVALYVANGVQLGALLLAVMNRYVAVPIGGAVPAGLAATQIRESGVHTLIVVGGSDAAHEAEQIAQQVPGLTVVTLIPNTSFALAALPVAREGAAARRDAKNGFRDDVLLLRTSGTTGAPKCVTYTLERLMRAGAMISRSLELSPVDLGLSMLPLHHIGGIACNLVAPTLAATPVAFHKAFGPKTFFDALSGPQGATWAYLVPAMWEDVLTYATAHPELRANRPWPRLRVLRSAGSELPHDVARALSDLFGAAVTILPTYGMTEAMPIASPPLSYRLEQPGSVGRVCPDVSVRIIDPSDPTFLPVANGTIGEVAVKGPTVFDGYAVSDAQDPDTFTDGGFFRTGDLGFLAEDGSGWLHIVGRAKDTINVGGETIAPVEIEAVLRRYPGWDSQATGPHLIAYARSHAHLGEDVAIAVGAGSRDVDLVQINAWARAHLPPAMLPGTLVHVPELPRLSAGKRIRALFSERFNKQVIPAPPGVLQTYRWQDADAAPTLIKQATAEHQVGAGPDAQTLPTLDQVMALVRQYTNVPTTITPDTYLTDAGVNSLAAVELSVQLGTYFQTDLPTWMLSDHPTPRALHAALVQMKRDEPAGSAVVPAAPPQISAPPRRMLFLHGEGADADLMEASLRATHWTSRLAGDIAFVFMDAPHVCPPMPAFHEAAAQAGLYTKAAYRSWRVTHPQTLQQSISAVKTTIEEQGPFDAIGGICDGALVAALVGSEDERLTLFMGMSSSPISRLAPTQGNLDWGMSCRAIHLVSPRDAQHTLAQQFEIAQRFTNTLLLQHVRGHAVPLLAGPLESQIRQALADPETPRPQEGDAPARRPPAHAAPVLDHEARTFEPVVAGEMARMIARQAPQSDTTAIVCLSNAASGPEVFALPTLNGYLSDYIALGKALEGNARLMGLRLGSLTSKSWRMADGLHALAREAAVSISQHASSREINLVGFSAAGVIAFETARQLQDLGYEIGCLAMVDSDATVTGKDWSVPIKYLSEWQKDISRRLRGKSNLRKGYGQLRYRAELTKWNPQPIDVKSPIFFKAALGTIDAQQLAKWRAALKCELAVVPIPGVHNGLNEPEVAAQIAQVMSARAVSKC